VGDASAHFDSNGAVSEAFSDHGVSVGTNGDISYTTSKERQIGGDTVSASITATISPNPDDGGSSDTAGERAGAEVMGGLAATGAAIYGVGGAVANFCTSTPFCFP
jgi:hypothetical protein